MIRHCIEVLGRIELTPAYVGERLEILRDNKNTEQEKFVKLYGEDHLQRTIQWFQQAARDLS